MIDTQSENEIKEVVLKTLKELGILPTSYMQTTLIPDELAMDKDVLEYMQDKQCLVWLGSNDRGEKQGVKCNQFYIAKRGSMNVDKSLPLTFEEVFNVWESYFKGNSLEDIYFTIVFDDIEVGLSDLKLVIWALLHGKCNYMLQFVNEDRYNFDFKKYEGRY